MSFDVNQFKLGMSLESVKETITKAISQNKGNVNEMAAKSIFDFIEDDIATGDGTISNENELHVLVSFIKNLFNKDAKQEVKMPDAAEWDGNEKNLRQFDDGKLTSTTVKEVLDSGNEKETTISKFKTDKAEVSTKVNKDILYDHNNDGIADSRTVFKDGPNDSSVSYSDNDLDGRFDEKWVYPSSHELKDVIVYKRKDDGNWELHR